MTTPTIPFEVAPWEVSDDWQRFRVGTCMGLWRCTADAYEILAVDNLQPGNGHFRETMLWFEQSCKRDSKALHIREVWNKELAAKLLKHGFTYGQGDDMVKRFTNQ